MFFKTIIQGRLEFATQKSFDKVLKMFIYRAENYHRNEMIFASEEIFNKEKLLLDMIDSGILSDTVELVVDATKGELDVNAMVKVAAGCCATFLKSRK